MNTESAAFDYVQTALENEIPELSEREKLVFDSLAKFGSPPGAENFGLPEQYWNMEIHIVATNYSSKCGRKRVGTWLELLHKSE